MANNKRQTAGYNPHLGGFAAKKQIPISGGTYLGLTFSRPADLGTFTINLESSVDLTNWEKIEAVILETFNASNDTYTVTIRDIQALDTKDERFIRLVISDEG